MSDKKLESFKIGDTRKPTVSNVAKKSETAPTESQSIGFKRIEGILEQEDPSVVGANMRKMLNDLEEFEKDAGSNKDKAAVKKAIAAVERTADLMDFLFQTKASMQSGQPK